MGLFFFIGFSDVTNVYSLREYYPRVYRLPFCNPVRDRIFVKKRKLKRTTTPLGVERTLVFFHYSTKKENSIPTEVTKRLFPNGNTFLRVQDYFLQSR